MVEVSLDKHREAGEIVREAKEVANEAVEVGSSALDVAETVEETIEEMGGAPAFPCNVSVNEVAAHYTPGRDDDLSFDEGDLVKIDIGAHIDGYIADSAFTVSLGGDDGLVEAAEDGLAAGIDAVSGDTDTDAIGSAIEAAIESHGCNPVVNLTGHGLERYVQHAEPSIPNVGRSGIPLDEGQVIAIEPFTTHGDGRVKESKDGEIYSLKEEEPNTKVRRGRKLLKQVKEYRTLPFARRWLPAGGKTDIELKMLIKAGVVRNYPVLKETSGKPIAQAEETVIIQDDGCEVITT